jgi:hypothetical protein
LFSIIEQLLPAILVSYNNHLKSRVASLIVTAEISETQRRALDGEIKIDKQNLTLGRRALLDRAIAKRKIANTAPE